MIQDMTVVDQVHNGSLLIGISLRCEQHTNMYDKGIRKLEVFAERHQV